MFNYGNGASLADVATAAALGNGNGNWGGFDGGAWWILLFILAFAGFGGNGFFGNGWGNGSSGIQDALTRSDLTQEFNFQGLEDSVATAIQGIGNLGTQVATSFDGIVDTLHQGFNTNTINTLNATSDIQSTLNAMNIANLQSANAMNIANLQSSNALSNQMQNCCCDNQARLAQISYDMATNTCDINTNNATNTRDIIDSQNAGTRAILEAIQQSKVEALQDRIADLTSQNQTLRFAASQAAQNAYLVDELRPSPVPAYTVPNPYFSYGYPYNYGCGCSGCNA